MKALLEEEAKNAKTIEEEIEEERQKVDAKTPITQSVCLVAPLLPLPMLHLLAAQY